MRILIKGYYGFGNFGDDILFITTWRIVRNLYPQAEISVFSNFNENLFGFSRKSNYNHYLFKLIDSDLILVDWTYSGYFDLVIDGGGGVYFDFSRGPVWRRLFNTVIKFIGVNNVSKIDAIVRFLTLRSKRISYNKRIAIGLGLGPYSSTSTLFYNHATEIGSTNAFFVRDQQSLELLNSIKFQGDKYLFTDLAFLTHLWMGDLQMDLTRRVGKNVGIILLDWCNDNHDDVLKDFANYLLKMRYRLTFYSLDENTDQKYQKKFSSTFDFIGWQPDRMDMTLFLKSLISQNIVFSARAHGVIASSLLGIPTVCLGPSQKLKQVSKMFSRSSYLVSEIHSLDDLLYPLKKIEENYAEVLTQLSLDVDANKALALNMVSNLSIHLKDSYD